MTRDELVQMIGEDMKSYPTRRSALMTALHAIQNTEGWLSQDGMQTVSDALNVPSATVKGVATFYSMYRKVPYGRYLIQICTNVACMIMGAEQLVGLLKREFGLEPGGTTEDGKFSLVIMECIGACGTAPAMLVNDDFHEDLDEKKILEILKGYQ